MDFRYPAVRLCPGGCKYILSRPTGTIKDAVTRYAHQSGHYVSRRAGWDCHGLPVEYEIDQALKITHRDQVSPPSFDFSRCRMLTFCGEHGPVQRWANGGQLVSSRLTPKSIVTLMTRSSTFQASVFLEGCLANRDGKIRARYSLA